MAKNKISAVINTLNEEHNLAKCLDSLSFCDEIIVVDMMSDDGTKAVAKKYTSKVFDHKRTGYVEPARNFAISKASNEYILIVDADEAISKTLAKKLLTLAESDFRGYAFVPRDNIIFGGSVRHAGWWPDYNIRFFRSGHVKWDDKIHSVPVTKGESVTLDPDPSMAIVHHNYPSLSSYIQRLDRYTTIQAKELQDQKLHLSMFVSKPWAEFLRRYFAMEGYKDGIRGLILCVLQAFSEFVVVTKIWELKDYPKIDVNQKDIDQVLSNAAIEYKWWSIERQIKNSSAISGLFLKIKRKL
jgi:glycosyltransferase involved in cell wall biosynthesis